jgi:putative ABC transport system permease protein
MNNIGQDIRYALRGLRKSPGFAVIAVLTLALGIGANTAIFTVVNAVFFHSIPVDDPKHLVGIFTVDQRKILGLTSNNNFPNSYPNASDIQKRAQSFSGITIFTFAPVSMTINGQPGQYFSNLVSGNFFDVLGVRAALGRTFRPDEDRDLGAGPVLVLNYGFWQRKFAWPIKAAALPRSPFWRRASAPTSGAHFSAPAR